MTPGVNEEPKANEIELVKSVVVLDSTKMGSAARTFGQGLRSRFIGQDEAVDEILDAYQKVIVGMASRGRPLANFLFMGPTGVGKTKIVEALAENLYGDPKAMIKIDCGEFQHSHEIAKLLGSPPGYLGHRETKSMLCQENLDRFRTEKCNVTLLLFDEIEKASDAVWKLMLGILDKAELTLGDNTKSSFVRCMVFMSSNLGAQEIMEISEKAESLEDAIPMIRKAGTAAARAKFSPEFMNRIDHIVVFRPLTEEEFYAVLDLELAAVERRIKSSNHPARLSVSRKVKQLLVSEGVDPVYGARHLKRVVEKRLVSPIVNLMATGQLFNNPKLFVESEDSELVFKKEVLTQRAAG